MFKNIDWKRFFVSLLVLCPVLIGIDIAYDAVFKTLVWKQVFATDNLFFKIAAAIVLAYFYATYNSIKSDK